MSMIHKSDRQTYLVIGCGYFGHRAVQVIKGFSTKSRVIAVDKDSGRLQTLGGLADQVHHRDGVQYLAELSERQEASFWVIPALPLHLSFAWLLYVLNSKGDVRKAEKMQVPQEFNPRGVLLQHRTPEGTLYTSFSSFTCPEDCPEPEGYCYVTEQPRPAYLYRILKETPCEGYRSLVVRSQLVAPGVGGYPFTELLKLRASLSNTESNYLLSTACTCHGVTDALSIHEPIHS